MLAGRFDPQFIREVGIGRWLWRSLQRQLHKRLLPGEQWVTLPNGLPLLLPRESGFASAVFVTQCDVDWGAERLLVAHLDRDASFIDVGSHFGYYALYVLPYVRDVHAFEPDPRSRVWLERNLARSPSAHIVAKALSSRHGTSPFIQTPRCETSHIPWAPDDTTGPLMNVEVTTIDRYANEQALRVGAIKIDAEGHDMEVLRGAASVMCSDEPLVLAELPPTEELFQFLAGTGYLVFAYVRSDALSAARLEEIRNEVRVGAPVRTKMLFLVPPRLTPSFRTSVGAQVERAHPVMSHA